MTAAYPDGNPKTALGAMKVPLHLVPPSATHYLALALADGERKYGPYNWRDKKVSATTYVGAMKRHIDKWFDGEEVSDDALVHHLAHAMACCAIILDADSLGKLNDDRPPAGAAARLQAEYEASSKLARAMDPVYPDAPTIVPHNIAAAYLRDVGERDDDLPINPVAQNTGD